MVFSHCSAFIVTSEDSWAFQGVSRELKGISGGLRITAEGFISVPGDLKVVPENFIGASMIFRGSQGS